VLGSVTCLWANVFGALASCAMGKRAATTPLPKAEAKLPKAAAKPPKAAAKSKAAARQAKAEEAAAAADDNVREEEYAIVATTASSASASVSFLPEASEVDGPTASPLALEDDLSQALVAMMDEDKFDAPGKVVAVCLRLCLLACCLVPGRLELFLHIVT
jgi:hypothetical protein